MNREDWTQTQKLEYWVKERESIRVLKATGAPPPWTTDEIFQTYKFCNVRREDDRVTKWIKKNIREPYKKHLDLWFMLCIARQINWPPTLSELMYSEGSWPGAVGFSLENVAAVLSTRRDRGDKLYTGAYMVRGPAIPNTIKSDWTAKTVLNNVWKARRRFDDWFSNSPTLRGTVTILMDYPDWGPFMSYQAVVDMRFTSILNKARDRKDWAMAGPGTKRGLNRFYGRRLKEPLDQEQALEEMRHIADILSHLDMDLDFSDIPNILCEFDKYERTWYGQGRPRSLYKAEGRF